MDLAGCKIGGGSQMPTHEGDAEILRVKRGRPEHVWQSIYSKRLSRGQNWYGMDANWGVQDGGCIGATW